MTDNHKEKNIMSNAVILEPWDNIDEASLMEALKKAIKAGTPEAILAFDRHLERLYHKTEMTAGQFVKYDAAMVDARVRLGLTEAD